MHPRFSAVRLPSAAAPAPSTAASRESAPTDEAALEARRKADAEAAQRRQCEQYRGELVEVRRSQGTSTSIQEAERLHLMKRELEKKMWEACG